MELILRLSTQQSKFINETTGRQLNYGQKNPPTIPQAAKDFIAINV